MLKKKAIKDYIKGKVTLSEAARKVELTLWEMEKCLVDNGFKSSYSAEDLERELNLLSSH